MFKFLLKSTIVVAVLAGLISLAYGPVTRYIKEMNKPEWETDEVVRGDALRVINATGTVRPVLSVSVGSFVSGPITELNVDFNDEVKKDDILAVIDPRLFAANVARDKATLATREAEVLRVKAQVQQAKNNKARGEKLRKKNKDFLSDREMDALKYELEALEAQVKVAEAAVLASIAGLENSQANLEYTEIKAPVDGIIIDRKIDPGQTLAAQFQTPELFIVAPDLREKVHIFASVDEADIGLIQKAQLEDRPVTFTVYPYPDELFEGEIEQVRMSSTDVQGVVTYPVVVAATNHDLKLLPGMTASISFEVDSQDDVLKVPNAAIRYYPTNVEHVREEDKSLLDGSRWKSTEEIEEEGELTAKEKTETRRKMEKRHVWIRDGEKLKAVEIMTGISENKTTVLVEGELKEGDEVITRQTK